MPRTTDSALRDRVDAFVEDLTELIRESALEAVQDALDASPARGRKKRSTRKAATRKKTTRKKKSAGRKKTAGRRTKRIRRSAEDLEETANRILTYIKSNPGRGMAAMSKALRKPAKDLRGPLKLLFADRKLRTEGQKRGTTYYAGGAKGRPAGTTAKKKRATTRRKKTGKKRRTTKRKRSA